MLLAVHDFHCLFTLLRVLCGGADVAMWLAALKKAEPVMYGKIVNGQCGDECAFL